MTVTSGLPAETRSSRSLEAYGWPADLPETEILERLVALNAERAAEEARGLVRWLRPEYQTRGLKETQAGLESVGLADGGAAVLAVRPTMAWPKTLPERFQAVTAALTGLGHAARPDDVAAVFSGGAALRGPDVAEILPTLEALGQVRQVQRGWYAGG